MLTRAALGSDCCLDVPKQTALAVCATRACPIVGRRIDSSARAESEIETTTSVAVRVARCFERRSWYANSLPNDATLTDCFDAQFGTCEHDMRPRQSRLAPAAPTQPRLAALAEA